MATLTDMNGKKYYQKFKKMSKQDKENNNPMDADELAQGADAVAEEKVNGEDPEAVAEEVVSEAEESLEQKLARESEELKAQVEKEKKEYMFLMAEFDNFRKRTINS